MITWYLLLYEVHKILVLAFQIFIIKVDKTNTRTQHFNYSVKNKQYIKSRIYEHVSLRFK